MQLHNLLNLTPHDVVLWAPFDGESRPYAVWPASGDVARVSSTQKDLGGGRFFAMWPDMGNGQDISAPVWSPPVWGEVTGIPDGLTEGILVSALVGQALAASGCKLPVFGPDTGPESAVRNDKGQIIGCLRLIRYC